MKIAINYDLGLQYQMGSFTNAHQVVVEIDRIDEIDLWRQKIEKIHGAGSFKGYFQVPDNASITCRL